VKQLRIPEERNTLTHLHEKLRINIALVVITELILVVCFLFNCPVLVLHICWSA